MTLSKKRAARRATAVRQSDTVTTIETSALAKHPKATQKVENGLRATKQFRYAAVQIRRRRDPVATLLQRVKELSTSEENGTTDSNGGATVVVDSYETSLLAAERQKILAALEVHRALMAMGGLNVKVDESWMSSVQLMTARTEDPKNEAAEVEQQKEPTGGLPEMGVEALVQNQGSETSEVTDVKSHVGKDCSGGRGDEQLRDGCDGDATLLASYGKWQCARLARSLRGETFGRVSYLGKELFSEQDIRLEQRRVAKVLGEEKCIEEEESEDGEGASGSAEVDEGIYGSDLEEQASVNSDKFGGCDREAADVDWPLGGGGGGAAVEEFADSVRQDLPAEASILPALTRQGDRKKMARADLSRQPVASSSGTASSHTVATGRQRRGKRTGADGDGQMGLSSTASGMDVDGKTLLRGGGGTKPKQAKGDGRQQDHISAQLASFLQDDGSGNIEGPVSHQRYFIAPSAGMDRPAAAAAPVSPFARRSPFHMGASIPYQLPTSAAAAGYAAFDSMALHSLPSSAASAYHHSSAVAHHLNAGMHMGHHIPSLQHNSSAGVPMNSPYCMIPLPTHHPHMTPMHHHPSLLPPSPEGYMHHLYQPQQQVIGGQPMMWQPYPTPQYATASTSHPHLVHPMAAGQQMFDPHMAAQYMTGQQHSSSPAPSAEGDNTTRPNTQVVPSAAVPPQQPQQSVHPSAASHEPSNESQATAAEGQYDAINYDPEPSAHH